MDETQLKYFDFNRMLNDLKSDQLFITKERVLSEQYESDTYYKGALEPLKSQYPISKREERQQWELIVKFMKNNP